jgi:hypothetical protein
VDIRYRNRKACQLENEELRVILTREGGHVAQILHKASGLNPLWTPPWPTIEPSAYSHDVHPEYGRSAEAYILSGIMGHSICLDTYGAPSPEEAAAGMPIHGEGSVAPYEVTQPDDSSVSLAALLPLSQIRFHRRVSLRRNVIFFDEAVENLASFDRPIAWTQHVTLGPPFVERGQTELRMPVKQSRVIDQDFGGDQKAGAQFAWPLCPRKDGGVDDLRRYPAASRSAGFTTHLIDPAKEQGFFAAWHPVSQLAFGYVWKRRDFPWVCRWEENCTRAEPPWKSSTITCAIEFGVTPTLGTRRQMVDLGIEFGERAFRWLPAKSVLTASYCAFAAMAPRAPESAVWTDNEVQFT